MLLAGQERQVLLEVPATSFSHFCGFKGVGLTEKYKGNQHGNRYEDPSTMVFSQFETIQGGELTEMAFRGDLNSKRIAIREILIGKRAAVLTGCSVKTAALLLSLYCF